MLKDTAELKSVICTLRGFTKLQALFRGNKCRRVHVKRARNNLPWSPFVPAKLEAVHAMLDIADLQPGETLVDIGSGDGRVVIEAAVQCPELKKARGFELDEALVKLSRRRIMERALFEEQKDEKPEQQFRQEKRGATATALRERAEIIHADFMQVDMRDADVVVLFFLPHEDIARTLEQKLRPGTRVITYVFQIAQWKPEKVIRTVPFMTEKGSSSIYLYRIPNV
ncbi:Cyclopropane-fatty-acyl-phospholipid synthase [Phytophthora megakarya]|uniref:Cyclopropane-fatty-acyl-phospholipid synthase n=1 Tax=Phytophthora megakarya TaxID=4795 RepID=A0A225WZK8_9STRA|nr:Cyclopropane-fatty-acyl-phospholipid synthase [Phytophthora megakarya]